jgi:hypothetical protein
VRRAGLGLLNVGRGAATALIGVVRGRAAILTGVQRIWFGAGLLTGLVGLRYDEYAVIHGG